jgi:hypothetical protein
VPVPVPVPVPVGGAQRAVQPIAASRRVRRAAQSFFVGSPLDPARGEHAGAVAVPEQGSIIRGAYGRSPRGSLPRIGSSMAAMSGASMTSENEVGEVIFRQPGRRSGGRRCADGARGRYDFGELIGVLTRSRLVLPVDPRLYTSVVTSDQRHQHSDHARQDVQSAVRPWRFGKAEPPAHQDLTGAFGRRPLRHPVEPGLVGR